MKLVARMALQDGMIIGEDIYSYQNKLLVKEGTIVDRQMVQKLARYSIMCAAVKDTSDSDVKKIARLKESHSFKQFANTYHKNLEIFKQMISEFLSGNSQLHTTSLLRLHENIKCSVSSNEQLFHMLFCLELPPEDLTFAHCLNSALVSNVFGSWLLLPEDDLKTLTLCGFLYDIGKCRLPNQLVWKTEPLNNFEANWLKTHTTIGFELLKNENLNQSIIRCTLSHHERCDGSGYPHQLTETFIDRFSKYIAITDDYLEINFYHNTSSGFITSTDIIDRMSCPEKSHKYDETALQIILKGVSRL